MNVIIHALIISHSGDANQGGMECCFRGSLAIISTYAVILHHAANHEKEKNLRNMPIGADNGTRRCWC